MNNSHSENLQIHDDVKENFRTNGKYNNLERPAASSSASSQRNEVEQEGLQGFDENNKVAKKTKNQKLTPEERIEKRKADERARYHRKTPEQKKAYNQKIAERKRLEKAEVFSTPSDQLTPELIAKKQKLLDRKLRSAERRRIHSAQLTDAQKEERNEKQRKARAEKARKEQDLDPCGFFAQMEKQIARQTDKAIKKISEN